MTHFFHFLLLFINKSVNPKHIKGSTKGLVKILDNYDKDQQLFSIAGKHLTLTAIEFEAIFGIGSGNKKIDMKESLVDDSSLGKRKFANINTITLAHLKTELKESIKSSAPQDVEDTVKLVILHGMACVLFVASSDVIRWWMLRICEDLYDLKNYN